MYIFSSYNRTQEKGTLYSNYVTKKNVKRSAVFDKFLKELLSQQLDKIESSVEGKLKQIITAELLYRGIIIPVEEKERELEYLKSLIKFTSPDCTFFCKNLLTEAKLAILEADKKSNKIIFCGIPVDIGAPRPGTRHGPKLLRERSSGLMFRGNDAKLLDLMLKNDIFADKEIYDIGDVHLPLDNKAEYLNKVAYAAEKIYQKGTPFFIGGDHLFTFPLLEGVYKARGKKPFTLVQMDYHLDVQIWDEFEKNKPKVLTEPTHANFVSWAHKSIPGLKTYQIGINNYQSMESDNYLQASAYLKDIGVQISNLEVISSKEDMLMKQLPKGEEVYLTIDVDVLNKIYVPNTGYPAPLGMQLKDFYNIVTYICRNNNIIGVDVMEFGDSHKFDNQLSMCEIVVDIILQVIKNIKI